MVLINTITKPTEISNMQVEFTNAEKVLYKMAYDFALNVEKLTEAEAKERGMNKVLQKRAMAKSIKFKH